MDAVDAVDAVVVVELDEAFDTEREVWLRVWGPSREYGSCVAALASGGLSEEFS